MQNGQATRDVLIARWTEIGDKVVGLAAEFPEERYDFAPAAGVRSFGDQLRHVAFWNAYVGKTLRREEADGAANELPRESFPSKESVVGALRGSFDEVSAALAAGKAAPESADLDSLVSFIQHGGEHYGQLVVYYRLNGLVPPVSRA
jgi:uncharacterized damage-inducible protein DinB